HRRPGRARDAMSPPAVELRAISKRFGPLVANHEVSLTLARGTVHGIVGETVRLVSPADAIARGIGMVHQHFMLIDRFTVLENLLLGAPGGVLLGKGAQRARAA